MPRDVGAIRLGEAECLARGAIRRVCDEAEAPAAASIAAVALVDKVEGCGGGRVGCGWRMLRHAIARVGKRRRGGILCQGGPPFCFTLSNHVALYRHTFAMRARPRSLHELRASRDITERVLSRHTGNSSTQYVLLHTVLLPRRLRHHSIPPQVLTYVLFTAHCRSRPSSSRRRRALLLVGLVHTQPMAQPLDGVCRLGAA